jgi:hypothetical protein
MCPVGPSLSQRPFAWINSVASIVTKLLVEELAAGARRAVPLQMPRRRMPRRQMPQSRNLAVFIEFVRDIERIREEPVLDVLPGW